MDREQVIKGLECCASLDGGGCAVCDWADPEEYECFSNLGKAALELLKEAEPVKHGRWIKDCLVSTTGDTYDVIRCSQCGWAYPLFETKYCPTCGAKMEEEEENE